MIAEVPQKAVLKEVVAGQPYPLLFATVSGAHLYGFASADSDFDVRGVHVLPTREVVGLYAPQDTIEYSGMKNGIEIDLVTHDAHKYFRMLLKKNGYVLEQLYSPLVVQAAPELEELREIARGCVTKHHAHHYRGFAHTQWELFAKAEKRRVKPLLYVYRVLLSGIHLMRTGEVESNLPKLNLHFGLSFIDELIERKRGGVEHESIDGDFEFHEAEFKRLVGVLDEAQEGSSLPELPSAKAALNDLLIRLRILSNR